ARGERRQHKQPRAVLISLPQHALTAPHDTHEYVHICTLLQKYMIKLCSHSHTQTLGNTHTYTHTPTHTHNLPPQLPSHLHGDCEVHTKSGISGSSISHFSLYRMTVRAAHST